MGKTTLLELLQRHGYTIFPEAARTEIDEKIALGFTIEQIRGDELRFQLDVLGRKADIEHAHDPNIVTFFDRGMHDTLAYIEAHGMQVGDNVRNIVSRSHYKKVFLLEPLPKYEQDYARTENEVFRSKITGLLHKTYAQAGIDVVIVPPLTPAKRVEFVLENM